MHNFDYKSINVGDIINLIRGNSIVSDSIVKISITKKGYTYYTKSKFHPIKTWEYDVDLVCKYPIALADYYIGTTEEVEKALKASKKNNYGIFQ